MPLPVLFFAAAGAAAAGGLGSGIYFWQRGQQEAAKKLQEEDQEAIKESLEREISLQDLRDEALQKGLDPDEVERGYKALRDGQLSLDQALEMVTKGSQNTPGRQLPGSGPGD